MRVILEESEFHEAISSINTACALKMPEADRQLYLYRSADILANAFNRTYRAHRLAQHTRRHRRRLWWRQLLAGLLTCRAGRAALTLLAAACALISILVSLT
jgi:hypothetical protein